MSVKIVGYILFITIEDHCDRNIDYFILYSLSYAKLSYHVVRFMNFPTIMNLLHSLSLQLIHQAEARHQEVLVGIACLELVLGDE